ncbi:S66 family peptidase [Halalkalibacterium halodurans]|uniref:Peptidase S66 n=2 Tax=Halalkalibacterium halodurans TaxID=86665 RepID=A0A0M0KCW1_ALKHA|nr:S66 peptidase family protein [Halalkalibacterium halodurans]TPE70070.1 LD-carboxypeptidase [Halalkalibacterium halodurans]
MIRYPVLKEGATIGVTAPSSGVPKDLHDLVKAACERMEERGFRVVCGETVWTQEKAKSSEAKKRATELQAMMEDDAIDLMIPPWGGQLLIEVLPFLDFEQWEPKWILGYSDTSLLLLAITLNTGIATAHGTNLVDLRGEYSDDTTAMWQPVLSTKIGASIVQHSSKKYQKEWDFERPTPCVFHLTEKTKWQGVPKQTLSINGRLLGGCIDVIRHLIGTPYGDVTRFQADVIKGAPIIWFFENCELTTTDLRRTLVQMKLAGWFDHCSGIMFGRSPTNTPVEDYTVDDVFRDLYEELKVPLMTDIDCGHVPPQLTLINGAYAEIKLNDGKGTVTQFFKK